MTSLDFAKKTRDSGDYINKEKIRKWKVNEREEDVVQTTFE